ncbi:hypothetical protein JCM33374_g2595 [Metschnikowia sp. JCM 33374]|nr:hypothetical protein JCM33374_g2595 [Metschnikowia sp. JCM 33374]
MPFGIVLNDCNPIATNANFYVPSITSASLGASNTQIKASHVIFRPVCSSLEGLPNELSDLCLSPETTVLIRLPNWTTFAGLYKTLSSLSRPTAIIVPITQDLRHYAMLQDVHDSGPGTPTLVMELHTTVSEIFLRRYKCLKYMAVYISSPRVLKDDMFDHDAASLLNKSSLPVLLLDHEVSSLKPYSYWSSFSKPKLLPFSDMLIDPLQPLSVDMELDVYETFEKDRTKYAQYECAIEMAISDLSQTRDVINILVIGPGRGPLLSMVMKLARSFDTVVAIEKNPKCYSTLVKLCDDHHLDVELVLGDVRCLPRSKLSSFHLIISELLGSFACNEAAPEILDIFQDYSPVMIPQEFRNYVQPIYTDVLTEESSSRPYLAKLNSYFPVCEPVQVFEYLYPGHNNPSQHQICPFCREPRM